MTDFASRLTGSMTALITPFRDGAVDEKAFLDLIERQIGAGTRGLVPCGTTGESPTLSHDEHHRVVELCIAAAKGRALVIAGTGSNATAEAISLTRHAEKAGADAAMVVTPYYNRPTQEGLYRHFQAIHDATALPIVIYNIPPRSAVDMTIETMARLAELPRIVGVKDATMDMARPIRTLKAITKPFAMLSGEDNTALAFLAQGGAGCISVTANVAPRLCAEMHEAWAAGDIARAQRINLRLIPLHDALFAEASPGPVKHAARLLGICADDTRLPLAPIAPATRERVASAMRGAGLIN